jgi:hypothetical protein
VRNQILSVSVTHSDLDAGAFATQVRDKIAAISRSPREVLDLLEAIVEGGRAALTMRLGGGEDTIDEARCAANELLKSLESDSIREKLRHQATEMNNEASDLERLTKQVAAERHRLTNGQG